MDIEQILEKRPLDIPAVARYIMLPLLHQASMQNEYSNARTIYRHMKATLPTFQKRLADPEMRATFVLEELVIYMRENHWITPVQGHRWEYLLTKEGLEQLPTSS